MNTAKACLLYAIERGYKVDVTGTVTGPKGNVLGRRTSSDGYLSILVRCRSRGICGNVPVHRLIAYLKFGEQIFETGIETRHKDNNKFNNQWDNILIGTHTDNMQDVPPERRSAYASYAASHKRKLDDAEVEQLRAERAAGATFEELMAKYKISKTGVSYIVNGKTYKTCGPRSRT